MFEELAAVLEQEVPSDARGFAQALEFLDRFEARLHVAAGECDARGAWAEEGCVDMAAFVAYHGRSSRPYGRRLALRASKLRRLPVLAEAWCSGAMSKYQVDVVLAAVGRHIEIFASQEAELVPTLAALGPRETEAAMAEWRRRADALDDGEEKPEAPSELYLTPTMDDRRELSGHFSGEEGDLVAAALDAARSKGGDGSELVSAAQQRADALVGICRAYLAGQGTVASGRYGAQVAVLVSYDGLVDGGPGRTAGGRPVSPRDVERASCDAVLHRLVYSGRSAVLDYGTGTRTISNSLWSALVARDGHCRHPGCDRPPNWCEGHHVVHFRHGGPTRLDNLVLACSRHHHIWHAGWQLELQADGVLELVSPDGQVMVSRPPPLDFLLE